jgi:hypothetical protein
MSADKIPRSKPVEKSVQIKFSGGEKNLPHEIFKDSGQIFPISIARTLKSGQTIPLQIAFGKISAVFRFPVFAGETIYCKRDSGHFREEWKLVRREFWKTRTIGLGDERKHSASFYPDAKQTSVTKVFGQSTDSFFRALEALFSQNQGSEPQEASVLRYLAHHYGFPSLNSEDIWMEWTGEEESAEGIFHSEETKKSFILRYESKKLGLAKFRFSYDPQTSDWSLSSFFQEMQFYEVFLRGMEDLWNRLEEAQVAPAKIDLVYDPEGGSESSRGWLA